MTEVTLHESGDSSDLPTSLTRITAWSALMDRAAPATQLKGRLGIPDDAVGTEITTTSDRARVDSHRWRLWAEVDRRPFLTTGGTADAPHREECSCWSCGGEAIGSRGQHRHACVCWQCAPNRWRGRRHGRLLRHLYRKREIYDAQSSPFGVWELLPFVTKVGLEWLTGPTPRSAESGLRDGGSTVGGRPHGSPAASV